MVVEENCWLCRENRYVLNQKLSLPTQETFIYESKYCYSHIDIAPAKVGHLITSTKRHVQHVNELSNSEMTDLKNHLLYTKKLYPNKTLTYSHINPKNNTPCVKHLHFHTVPCNSSYTLISKLIETNFCSNNNISESNNDLLIIFMGSMLLNKAGTGTLQRSSIERTIGMDLRNWRIRLSDDSLICNKRIIDSIKILKGPNYA